MRPCILPPRDSASRNYNNHPFRDKAGVMPSALAHSGVLCNDSILCRSLRLPATHIETGS